MSGSVLARLRRPLVVCAVLAAAAAGLLLVVWLAAPRPDNLGRKVLIRERATGVTHPVPLAEISLSLRQALVATEDERFYQNHGIDLLGIARAVPYDAAHLSFAQGASTITDQLAKLLYLGGNDHSVWRKLEDLALALRISTRYSKEQVLDAYLNTAYFGHGAYGVEAASRRYFGVAPSRLTLAQGSLLAGLVQAPTGYDPLVHPLAARNRQVAVLRSLVRDGYTTSEQATRVLAAPLPLIGGRQLPALPGVSVTSEPAFAWGGLALGATLIATSLLGAIGLRRLPQRPRTRLAIKAACFGCVLLGAVTITNSFNGL